ncbi:hypothetical protein GCM10010530_18420 [Kribbella aluminosa]
MEQLHGPHCMPGGARFELKWDGFVHGTSQAKGPRDCADGDGSTVVAATQPIDDMAGEV